MGSNANQASPPMMTGPAPLGALNAAIVIQDVDYVAIQFTAGLVGTVAFEQSNDNVNWDVVRMSALASPANTAVASVINPTAVIYGGPVQARYFRARVSAYTSGTCNAIMACYEGILGPFMVAVNNTIAVTPSILPAGATSKSAFSGNVAAGAANATIAAPGAGITTWVTGFEVTGAGATAATVVNVTLTGMLGGTITYTIVVPAGVTTTIEPLIVEFNVPLPASGPNVAVAINVPSFGAGNTNVTSSIHGYSV